MTHRVLLIDDDAALTRLVSEYLGGAGLAVESCAGGAAGLAALRRAASTGRPFDLLVLDLMLPDTDGLELCRRLRADADAALAALPIVMLTARGDEADRIVGLELGADDYLGKPFHPRELLARLRAVLRRGAGGAARGDAPLRFGRLEIDRGARVVRVDGEARTLTGHQFDLLVALAEGAGRVLSREALMSRLRGRELEAFDRSIDVHVSRIRAAIEDDAAQPRRILTVRGVGYVFASKQDASEARSEATRGPASREPNGVTTASEARSEATRGPASREPNGVTTASEARSEAKPNGVTTASEARSEATRGLGAGERSDA